jgi:cell division protein FtsL
MLKRHLLLYAAVITIPLSLGLIVWQSERYYSLNKELDRLEQTQVDWVEANKYLITRIAELSSPQNIEYIAINDLHLRKIRPQDVLQIRIGGGKGHDL